MSDKSFSLLEYYNSLINEVGNLDKIEPYPYVLNNGGGNFEFGFNDEKYKVGVTITMVPLKAIETLTLPPVAGKTEYVFNIGYNIKGDDTQFMKTNFSTIIRIMKTFVDIIKDSLPKYPKDSIFIFTATSKIGKGFEDSQKMNLYKLILQQNMPVGYRNGFFKILGNDAVYLTKIK